MAVMIQDDFGNLVHTPGTSTITERLDDGDARMTRIEHDLAINTVATRETADNTSELVSILNALKGAFRVLEFVGKLAKPLGYIISLGAAIAGAWAIIKTGSSR